MSNTDVDMIFDLCATFVYLKATPFYHAQIQLEPGAGRRRDHPPTPTFEHEI